jgi:hypothetical protein
MCRHCPKAAGLRMAARGSTSTAFPSTRRNPVGVFIHALAMTTNTPEMAPLNATSTPEARWARGGTRSHP